MRLTLREFQDEAVTDLVGMLDTARYGYAHSGKVQSVGLAAPTGSGKTVIATALVERLLFGTDDGQTPPDPGAVFLWMTDLPQLNIQTHDKMFDGGSLLTQDRLVIIESTFDAQALDAGRVYFLNTQKLGSKGALGGDASPKRTYPFWDTVRNTIETTGRTLYLVIDEAHRGMTEGKDLADANSIIQRFIKGIPDVMSAVPIVVGISATPVRFNRLVEAVGRTSAWHIVPPQAVRESGLIKDRTVAHVSAEKQHDPMALLRKAAGIFHASGTAWAAYCASSGDEPVLAALIVQVENEAAGKVTATDLAEVISTITDVAGGMPDAAFAHAFGEGADIEVGSRVVRFIEPSRISTDTEARVIFFKSSLGTGWDCPRAEVMFSFRRAIDPTSIAQTVGRMVRTPLARRIDEDERLNSVDVFLPHFDRAGVEAIIGYLQDTGATAIDLVTGAEIVTLARLDDPAVVAAINAVPTYAVPTVTQRREVLRLTDLARALSNHGLDPEADAREKGWIAGVLLERRAALAGDEAFKRAVSDEGEIVIARVEWATGEAVAATDETLSIPASESAINTIFAAAKRALGGEAAEAYWKARVEADAGALATGRLEAYALSVDHSVMDFLNAEASKRIDALLAAHGHAIAALPPAKRVRYDRVRQAASKPTVGVMDLPTVIVRRRGPTALAKHLFADASGSYPTTLGSSWETETINAQIDEATVITWLRNLPTDAWALRVPWIANNIARPFYPDFMVVRRNGEHLVVDILDPHDHTRDDAPGKARGLAAYARDHGHLFGHIDLIAKVDGRMRTLHLETEAVRKQVDGIGDNNALIALYLAT